jgi:hypothetical protein
MDRLVDFATRSRGSAATRSLTGILNMMGPNLSEVGSLHDASVFLFPPLVFFTEIRFFFQSSRSAHWP